MVDRPGGYLTGFVARSQGDLLGVMVHQGLHTEIPKTQRPLAVAFYDEENRLYRRHELESKLEIVYHYDERSSSRWPVSKTTIYSDRKLETRYDSFGRPISGQQLRNGTVFDYEYRYKHQGVGDLDLVCATYKSVDDTFPALLTVYWYVESDKMEQWIPSNKVQAVRAVFSSGQMYEIRWIYKHARGADVEASVYLDGVCRPCFPPPEIVEETFGLLDKPTQFYFDDEDLLIYHSPASLKRMVLRNDASFARVFSTVSSSWPFCWMGLGEVVSYHKLSSSALRTALWESWQKAPYLDALTASFLDEFILRKEPLLRHYWRLRDSGYLQRAAETLDQDLEQIVSAIEPSYESSSKCPLLIKPADLFIMGLGKDANQTTARLDDAYSDSESATSVIFSDNGCWPDSPGGVSNCRRDLVDGHKTIRGHCLAESANDFGIPRYQIERNINSMKVLPLWGLDNRTAYHGVLDNILQSQVDEKISRTEPMADVEQIFVPLLQDLVRGARSRRYDRKDLVVYSNAFLKMNKYFETRDFNKTWQCEVVQKAWVKAWLAESDDPNVWNIREHSAIVHPSLSDFQEALNLYIAYFFIYSDLGTDQGLRGSKKIFARKIDPIVNGISNMDLFEPITETRSTLPTTVMLSNVQFIKDVKTAVLAADIIVNKYGFKDYQLVVYGAQDRQPSYVLETVQLINSRRLASNVTLAGFGSPKEVLKDAWLFVNSSLSEGLPLAIGEAALSGVPIVATEVGATALVLTDPDDVKKRYGEIVPPNDPESLARAQLSILAMMGPWAEYTKTAEPAPLPYTFTAQDVAKITGRMYEKQEDRRSLGLKLRDVVLRSFHGHRYLREHEQMFWIQRRRAEIRRSACRPERHPAADTIFHYDTEMEEAEMDVMRWQLFKSDSEHKRKALKQDVEQGLNGT
ncbi:hypothetical protein N0V91_011173 [Didymella pomorum]|uniref:Glycosyl transferase family 1 domain-containing protein n=1 Tax=Didymella pomorum TaxID=749634 RepID=A0A9W9D0S8_9PLEO|nr:hypothetical protein N0V91_011173 [Didymella pomorum]